MPVAVAQNLENEEKVVAKNGQIPTVENDENEEGEDDVEDGAPVEGCDNVKSTLETN